VQDFLEVDEEQMEIDRTAVEQEFIRAVSINMRDLECLTEYQGLGAWLNDNVVMGYLSRVLPEEVLIVDSIIWSAEYRFPSSIKNLCRPIYHEIGVI